MSCAYRHKHTSTQHCYPAYGICLHGTSIHCHSAFVKSKIARALKKEKAINNLLDITEVNQEGFSVKVMLA